MTDTLPQTRLASLAHTDSFSEADWLAWLERVFRGEPFTPAQDSGEAALYLQLASVYRQLPGKPAQGRFEQAVRQLFASTVTSPQYVEELYHLLQLISYIKPAGGEHLLRQRLLTGRLAGLRFDGRELDTLLLVVTAEYGLDPELTYYIHRTVEARADLRYALVGLRLLAPRGFDEYEPVLAQVAALVQGEADMAVAGRALRGIVGTGMGFHWLYQWVRHASASAEPLQAERLSRFHQVLLPLVQRDEHDPYACLLRGLAESQTGAVSPTLLLRIARFRTRVTEPEARWVLSRVWTAQQRCHPDRAPWEVLFPPPPEVADRMLREYDDCVRVRTAAGDQHRTESDVEVALASWLSDVTWEHADQFPRPRPRRLPGQATRDRELVAAGAGRELAAAGAGR